MRKHLQRLLHYRSRLSGQFSLGIGGAVALTVAASLWSVGSSSIASPACSGA